MLNFTKLWNAKYLFGPNPALLSRSDNIFLWTGAAFVAFAIVLKFWGLRQEASSPARLLWNRLFHNFVTMGILILVWTGCRYENIPWLGTHIVMLLLLIVWLVWLGFIGKYAFSEYPNQKKAWDGEKIKRKYLPR